MFFSPFRCWELTVKWLHERTHYLIPWLWKGTPSWTRCKFTLPLRCMDSLAPLNTFPWRDKTFWAISNQLGYHQSLLFKPELKNSGWVERGQERFSPFKAEIFWAALGSNGVLFWTLQAAQQKRRQNLLQASPPLPRQGWQLLKIVVGPHSATSCRALGFLPCLSFQCFHWVELDGEGNQQVLLRESRAAGTSVIYGLYSGRFFTVAWITLHACLKTNLFSGCPGTRRDQQ